MSRLFDAAQPCLCRVRRNAFNAPVTIAPMVSPLFLAYFRRSSTVGRRQLQRDRHRGLGNFDGSIELGGFLQVAICLTFRQIELG